MLEDNDLVWHNSNSYSPEEELEMQRAEAFKQIKQNKKFKITAIIMCIICVVFFIYEIIGVILIKTRNIMPEIFYNYNDYLTVQDRLKEEYFSIEVEDMSISEIKKQARKEVPVVWCIQIDVPNLGSKGGACSFLLGLIQISTNQNIKNYTKSIVHERLHLYYYTGCERFIQYQTFVTLYESENLFFHKAGIELAREILKGSYPDSYNCTGQIVEYLIERG